MFRTLFFKIFTPLNLSNKPFGKSAILSTGRTTSEQHAMKKAIIWCGLKTVVVTASTPISYAATVPFGGLCEPGQYTSCGRSGGGIDDFEFLIIALAIGGIYYLAKNFFFNSPRNIPPQRVSPQTAPTEDQVDGARKPSREGASKNMHPTTGQSGSQSEESSSEDHYGTYVSSSGMDFTGDLREGIAHGQGIARFPNGDKYIGEFKDGKRHGKGVLTRSCGLKLSGEFRANEYVSLGTDWD